MISPVMYRVATGITSPIREEISPAATISARTGFAVANTNFNNVFFVFLPGGNGS